jgi:hypothetical protein
MILSAMRRPVLIETLVLMVICMLDLFSTVVLIRLGLAVEANPILQPFAEMGVVAFIVAKAAFFIPPIAILETLRGVRPAFVRICLRACIVGYIGLYIVGSAGVNGLF